MNFPAPFPFNVAASKSALSSHMMMVAKPEVTKRLHCMCRLPFSQQEFFHQRFNNWTKWSLDITSLKIMVTKVLNDTHFSTLKQFAAFIFSFIAKGVKQVLKTN